MDTPNSVPNDESNTPNSVLSFFPDELAELLPGGKQTEENTTSSSDEDEKKDEEPLFTGTNEVDTVFATAEYLASNSPSSGTSTNKTAGDVSVSVDPTKDAASLSAPMNGINVIQELALASSTTIPTSGGLQQNQEEQQEDTALTLDHGEASSLLLLEQWNDSVAKPIQRGMDEHLKPHFDKLGQAVDEHLKPQFDKLGLAVGEHIKPHLENLGQAVDEHVKPQFDSMGRSLRTLHDQTSQTMKQFGDDTKMKTRDTLDALGNSTKSLVENHVTPHVNTIQRATKQGIDHTNKVVLEQIPQQTQVLLTNTRKVLLVDLPQRSHEVVDRHVLPRVTTLRDGTQEKLNLAATKAVESYQKSLKPYVDQIQTKHEVYSKYYMNSAPGIFHDEHLRTSSEIKRETRLMIVAESCFMSFARVYFCHSPVSGFALFLGLLIASPMAALSSFVCVLSTIVTAQYWFNLAEDNPNGYSSVKNEDTNLSTTGDAKLDSTPSSLRRKKDLMSSLQTGTLGFNAVVVGAGCATFISYKNVVLGNIGCVIMSFVLGPLTLLTYLIMDAKYSGRQDETAAVTTPPLLLPSNLILGVVCISSVLWDRALIETPTAIAALISSHEEMAWNYSIGAATLNGISSIVSIPAVTATGSSTANAFSGIIILLGVVLCSRVIAAALLIGSLGGCLLGMAMDVPPIIVNSGLAGFNSALTCASLVYYYELPSAFFLSRSSSTTSHSIVKVAIVGFLAIVWTCLLQAAIGAIVWETFALPITLTLGYCVATIPILNLDASRVCGGEGTPKRIPNELLSMTPEEYFLSTSDDMSNGIDCGEGALTILEEGLAAIAGDTSNVDDVMSNGGDVASEQTPLIPK